MTETFNYIRTGFYDDFRGYDTILISVDISGLLEIENVFLQLANGVPSFNFHTLKYLDPKFQINIQAFNGEANAGLKQIDKGKFEWRLKKEKWNQFREMATALYHNGTGGHQYLDFETNYFDTESNFIELDSLQVVLSLNEYPLSFWETHFAAGNS
jgi:hypothetical protein